MTLLARTLAHGEHFWAHVGAIMALSGALERHWVAQGAQSAPCSAVRGGQCWSMLVNVGQGERSAARAGLSGGGGGFASELCKGLLTMSSTPCYL